MDLIYCQFSLSESSQYCVGADTIANVGIEADYITTRFKNGMTQHNAAASAHTGGRSAFILCCFKRKCENNDIFIIINANHIILLMLVRQ